MFLAALVAVAAQDAPLVVPIDYTLPPRYQTDPLAQRCRPGSGETIIVCGRRPRDYRVGPSGPNTGSPNLLRPYDIGGGATLTPAITQTYHDTGAFAGMVDRRITFSIRMPF